MEKYQAFWHMAVCQNLVPLVNIKIAGKWMFIPLKMVLIGIDPYPHLKYSKIILLVTSGYKFLTIPAKKKSMMFGKKKNTHLSSQVPQLLA